MRRVHLVAAIALGLSGITAAQAQQSADHFISLTLENDLFGSGNDRHYTHGTKLTYLSTDVPGWISTIGNRLLCNSCRDVTAVEYVLGQNIFTPDDISQIALQEADRPYAGWLYTGFTLYGADFKNGNLRKYDALQFNLGMVGPSSLADEAQTLVHKVIDAPLPNGWEWQLNDEPGFVFTYTRRWQTLQPSVFFNDLEHSFSPHVVGAIGNIYTYAGAGGLWRFGRNLIADVGPNTIRPGLPGASYFMPNNSKGWYFFAGFEGRAVARNIFLDGNTFSDSHSVDKKPFVLDAQFGFTYRWEDVRLTVANVFRTKEFEGQKESDEYGAVTLDILL